jgi:hypothetical protein
MKVYKYGIILERLKERDIELVREWRNSDAVRLNMEYRDIITTEQQIKWFRSVNNLIHNYLMIWYKGEKIGLLNDKNIDWQNRTSESGLFLGRTEFYSTFIPYLISIAGIELNFHFLNWEKQYAHILRSNSNAIKYNTALGYQLLPGQEDVENQLYEMTRESYDLSSVKIRKAVRVIASENILPKLLLEPEDYNSGIAALIEPLLTNRPEIRISESDEGKWFIQTS